MTEIIRSGSAAFVPRARLLKLLGGELIRDEVMAIVELVKNAHDADASRVHLDFLGAAGSTGEIGIDDDGHGMSLDVLLTSWMQPAGSIKGRTDRHYTPSGRRVLGEKGVGRFAVDRLGRHVELVSRSKGSRTEIVANFDWDEFDDEQRLLSEIQSTWNERSPAVFRKSGTRLRITGLRVTWTERMFRRLCARLQRLLSPLNGNKDFRIRIHSDEFPDYSGTLRNSFLQLSPYRARANFDGKGLISVSINDGSTVRHPWNGSGELCCGPVDLTLHGFDLDALARVGPPAEVRAWLKEWSGVSIYRDGFRVLPYGEPDDDWLRLDQRRVNNPVVRLSNNQICGFVEISRDANPDLRDQTNRGGLIQTRPFEDLRRLVLYVIQILEAERNQLRHPVASNTGAVLSSEVGKADEAAIRLELLEVASSLGRKEGARIRQLATKLEDAYRSRLARHEAELAAHIDLAAMGQSSAFLHHTLRPQLGILQSGFDALEERFAKGLGAPPEHDLWMMRNSMAEIEEAMKLLVRVAPAGKRRRRTIDLQRELQVFEETTVNILSDHKVKLDRKMPRNGLIRAEVSPETFQQVLHILLWNSLEWMEADGHRRIQLSPRQAEAGCRVIFQDSGPGIAPENAERVFQPQFSLKENGRGMGLTMARRLLNEQGASIRVLNDRRRKGATIEINLRAKRPRAT